MSHYRFKKVVFINKLIKISKKMQKNELKGLMYK